MDVKKYTKRFFPVTLAVLIFGIFYVILFFPKRNREMIRVADEYQMYCGSCHIAPEPSNIPKAIWEKNVLPEMAARMGYRYDDFNPYKYSIEENHYVRLSNAYPEEPILDSVTWERLRDYILSQAPDSVPNLPIRKGRSSKLVQFDAVPRKLDMGPSGGIVNIGFDPASGRVFIGDVFGQVHEWQKPSPMAEFFESPVVLTVLGQDTLYITEMGKMGPSEIPKGKMYHASGGAIPGMEKLHRPVYSQVVDLNGDGQNEILVCEFGHLTGELSLFVKKDSTFAKNTLMQLPGAIKVDILDIDGDGKKDIIALFSQGREGIYAFVQKDDLQFDVERLIGLPPEYGLSWFSVLDYNKDGHFDIVTANGDNADYSNFLKPYHGIRLYLNNGANQFTEEWFYPINGVTRVLADDFDLDGDIDFATMSFFPDFENNPEEGFVYLENQDAISYSFIPYVTEKAKTGNWLVMDKGDFDKDGDVDLMLGNFNVLKSLSFREENDFDILYLENRTIHKQL
ncbi:VCBS repeat-containing protein [Muricauda sp. MAR_2010_75]|uniref:FG-GAP repeat domain-containing protein n=1 Tax=Allomuricauda sp. MAR_2010_75 TaxID=1250232 RepID=UPI000561E246|nr:VCBS repeat-containing protein [Muricauda sp. MAR_2010_75]